MSSPGKLVKDRVEQADTDPKLRQPSSYRRIFQIPPRLHADGREVGSQQPGSVGNNTFSNDLPGHIPTLPLHGGGIGTAPAVQNSNFNHQISFWNLSKGNIRLQDWIVLFLTLLLTPRRPQLCWI